MVDAAKVQSFADRVLALKAQEDEIKKEIREVYAEAVEDEIDKTGLGQLVTHLRKRGKAPEDFDAKEAIFLGYLELYNVAFARTHAYARARTGEIIEGNEPASSEAQVRADRSEWPDRQNEPDHSPDAGKMVATSFPVTVEGSSSTGGTDVGGDGEAQSMPDKSGEGDAPSPAPAPDSEPGNGHVGETPASAGAPAAGEAVHTSPAVPASGDGLYSFDWLRRHGRCLDQENCDPKPGKLCITCSRAMAVVPAGETIEHRGSIN